MKCKVIFTCGSKYDNEFIDKDLRGDVLIVDEYNNYFQIDFITIERISNVFCNVHINHSFEEATVILRSIEKKNILESVKYLNVSYFHKKFVPLTNEIINSFYTPKEDWEVCIVETN